MDLKEIEVNYSKMTTEKLAALVKEADDLRIEVIPILQKELLNRGKIEESMALTNYLVERNIKSTLKKLDPKEIQELVSERLETGESLESIKIDLKDNGVQIFDALDNNNKAKEKALQYLTTLKEEGLDGEAINAKMKETFFIDEHEAEQLNSQLKRRGKRNLVFGYSVLALSAVLGISAMYVGSIGFGFFVIFGWGVWLVFEGTRQAK